MDTMEKQEFRETFAARLTEIIDKSPFTRRELAQELGISYPALASYLSGVALPPLQTACKLSTLLDEDLALICGLKNASDATPDHCKEVTDSAATPAAPPESDQFQTYVQQLLRTLYTAVDALGFEIITNSNDGTIALCSKNRFTHAFFTEMQNSNDLDATLGIFQDLQIYNKQLMDPISYKLALRATDHEKS